MVKIFSIFSCILATWAVVVSGRGHIHIAAPVQSPVEAPSSIGAPTVDCMSLIYDMADCIAYLSIDGGEDKPDKSCCSGFETVLNTDSDCICVALKSSASLGIEVNMTSARALPSACGIKAPPLNCNVSISPSTSPGTSPDHPNFAVNPPSVNAPNPASPNPSTAPTPTTKTPAPAAHFAPVGAPSPVAASSGGYNKCTTILSTIFFAALLILFFNILI